METTLWNSILSFEKILYRTVSYQKVYKNIFRNWWVSSHLTRSDKNFFRIRKKIHYLVAPLWLIALDRKDWYLAAKIQGCRKPTSILNTDNPSKKLYTQSLPPYFMDEYTCKFHHTRCKHILLSFSCTL